MKYKKINTISIGVKLKTTGTGGQRFFILPLKRVNETNFKKTYMDYVIKSAHIRAKVKKANLKIELLSRTAGIKCTCGNCGYTWYPSYKLNGTDFRTGWWKCLKGCSKHL